MRPLREDEMTDWADEIADTIDQQAFDETGEGVGVGARKRIAAALREAAHRQWMKVDMNHKMFDDAIRSIALEEAAKVAKERAALQYKAQKSWSNLGSLDMAAMFGSRGEEAEVIENGIRALKEKP